MRGSDIFARWLGEEGQLTRFVQQRGWLRSAMAGPRLARRMWLRAVARHSDELWDTPAGLTAVDMVRRIEELVTSDLRVRVPDFEGEFLLGPKSHLLAHILQTGAYEPRFAALVRAHIDPDGDVIDVGANVGFYTVLAARHLRRGRVLAAEPTAAAFRRLEANLAHNGVADRVIAFHGLIGAKAGVGTIHVVPGREEYSSVGGLVHPSIAAEPSVRETLPVQSIDALVDEHGLRPRFIKIDVEGGEEAVLDGAEQTLAKMRPVILSEFSGLLLTQNGSTPAGLLEKFDRWGYDVKDALGRDIALDGGRCCEILATPRS